MHTVSGSLSPKTSHHHLPLKKNLIISLLCGHKMYTRRFLARHNTQRCTLESFSLSHDAFTGLHWSLWCAGCKHHRSLISSSSTPNVKTLSSACQRQHVKTSIVSPVLPYDHDLLRNTQEYLQRGVNQDSTPSSSYSHTNSALQQCSLRLQTFPNSVRSVSYLLSLVNGVAD